MLAVTRLRVPPADEAGVVAAAQDALAALSARPGYLRGDLGRSIDDESLWLLCSRWVGVGAYRRGLSAYDVKVALAPLMAYVVEEAGAYEVVATVPPPPER